MDSFGYRDRPGDCRGPNRGCRWGGERVRDRYHEEGLGWFRGRRGPGEPGLPGCALPGGCLAAAGGVAFGSCTCAPSRRRSPPSVTTTSPAPKPWLTATRSPSTTPRVTGRTLTVRSGFTV